MKKIMFNDKYGLTQAVLVERKTQTRRLVSESLVDEYDNWLDDVMCIAVPSGTTYEKIEDFLIIRSKYVVGEVVAIAQSYKDCGGIMSDGTPRWDYISQMVGNKNEGWRNKMFIKPEIMPHQIRITNVRIERLQDISGNDCLAEGIEHLPDGGRLKPYAFYDNSIRVKTEREGIHYGWYRDFDTPREAYAALIDKISGKGTWEKNPYVWVYDFELEK